MSRLTYILALAIQVFFTFEVVVAAPIANDSTCFGDFCETAQMPSENLCDGLLRTGECSECTDADANQICDMVDKSTLEQSAETQNTTATGTEEEEEEEDSSSDFTANDNVLDEPLEDQPLDNNELFPDDFNVESPVAQNPQAQEDSNGGGQQIGQQLLGGLLSGLLGGLTSGGLSGAGGGQGGGGG